MVVAGLREGTMLIREGDKLTLTGKRNMRIFRHGFPPEEIAPGTDVSSLLKQI